MLRLVKNHINSKNINLNEPLPEVESQMKADAVKRNMSVSTHNFKVSVSTNRREQKPTNKKINEIDTLSVVTAIQKSDKDL